MNPVEQKWLDARNAILAETAGIGVVVCLVPRWEPVGLEMGLRWLQATIYEGFRVRHRVIIADGAATVQFKQWEYGEDEPDF